MTPKYDKIHNYFKLNGHHYSFEDLKEVAYSLVKEGHPYEQVTGDFLLDWLSDEDYLYVKTSGATGKPKNIKLLKQTMVNSAIATGNFFGLEPGNKALDCLPSNYIAGKMMLVRAMILGLEIDYVEPSAHPVFDYDVSYDFCAMIPLQLKHIINNTNNIKTIIIGGSKITKPLLELIKTSKSRFFETYGMTETVTHVAVKALKSKKYKGAKYFEALEKITFAKDKNDCLIINAPYLSDVPLVTNDIVQLISETSFNLIGRYDNVINSGGIKLYPEQIEDKLQAVINERFIITGQEDDDLGEKVVLIIENPRDNKESFINRIRFLKGLTKYEVPKEIFFIQEFPETANGKIQRKKSLEIVLASV